MRRRDANAFTLLEILIVIALLGILVAMVWPDFAQARKSEELDESVRRMKTLVQMCRARSMNEARRYRIELLQDGDVRVTRQRDPLYAPHQYVKFREQWVKMAFLLESVWVESVLPLPEGPPPIDVEDDLIEFDEFEEEPTPIEEFDHALAINFETDGTGSSARWILREAGGRGVQMTLDGRLGRVYVETVAREDPDGLDRPEPLDLDEDEIEFEEDLEVLEERP